MAVILRRNMTASNQLALLMGQIAATFHYGRANCLGFNPEAKSKLRTG